MSEPTGDGLLYLLKVEPSLLDPAPAAAGPKTMERRRLDEDHPCLRCGRPALCTYIAQTDLGPRWLDLCPPCNHWMLTTMTRREPEPGCR